MNFYELSRIVFFFNKTYEQGKDFKEHIIVSVSWDILAQATLTHTDSKRRPTL